MAEIKGLKQLSAELKRLPDKLRGKTLDNAAAAGARVIRDRAKNTYVPVDTGALKASIVVRKDRELSGKNYSTYNVGYLKKKAPYGGFVELGTSKMAPQPYLRPAIETEQNNAIDAVAVVLRKKLKL